MTQRKAPRIKRADEVEGKVIVCKGPREAGSAVTALRITHSDPSRRDSETIDLVKGASYRVPQDISVSDARLLLLSESWRFDLKDEPAPVKHEAQGSKQEEAEAEVKVVEQPKGDK